jgi:phenylacetate-CoA ligase
MRRLFIPAFEISPANIEKFVALVRKHNPVLVDGYAESLNFLATYVKSGQNPGFSPKAIMSSAQALPENTREVIERGFQTRVFDKYGSREFSGIAYECTEHQDHHIVDECYIVELLVDGRPAAPGEVGEIVITDLFNRATPMIRYRIGDLAVAVDESVPCACGRSHSRLGQIEGRTQAIVHCANGAWLPGTFFAHFFKDHEADIRFFQIVQSAKGSFVLKVVKNDKFSQESMNKILKSLREYIGDTTVTVEYVDEIPLVRTGKRSPVVSSVVEDFQALSVSGQVRRKDSQ